MALTIVVGIRSQIDARGDSVCRCVCQTRVGQRRQIAVQPKVHRRSHGVDWFRSEIRFALEVNAFAKLAFVPLREAPVVEITQASLMTGYMVCPGSDADNGAAISGGIVGETNIAVTNAHLFFDPVGNPRLPFEDCHFRNHAEPPGIIPFDISGGFYLGAKRLIQADIPRDFAVVKLAFRVEGADPYPIFVPDRGANIVGEEIIVLTAYAPSLGADQLGPIIQRCTVKMISRESETFNIITDCDLEPVGSGSLVLVRRGGILHALGLMSSSGKNHLDGVDFDLLSGSYSSGPGFYGDFESAIVALSHGTSVPANNSYLPE